MNKEVEAYIVKDNKNHLNYTVNRGELYNQIINILNEKYGKKSGDIIKNNVNRIYDAILNLGEVKNLLLVGKVQSGKTSNLELLTGLLFDNGFQLGIIYGGYSEELLKQTVKRFEKAYSQVPNRSKIRIIDTINSKIEALKDILPIRLKTEKILIISMKNHETIRNVTEALSKTNFDKYLTFIIDDEGDQASLNTEIRNNKESTTYKKIVEMIDTLNNPLYLSSTATPNAIVFQPSTSRIEPKSVVLIEPGEEYCGADFFHRTSDKIIFVNDNEEENKMSNDMKNAFRHFLISSAILHIEGIDTSSMIVHTDKEIVAHAQSKRDMEAYKKYYEGLIKVDRKSFCEELEVVYREPFFDKSISDKYSIDVLVKIVEEKVLPELFFIQYNSEGGSDLQFIELKRHTVSIGGELIQRGVTFDNLVTSYFTRSPKSGGNMDTTLQRARWFGYRKKISHLIRIFTTEELLNNFNVLADIESQLWDQFYEVQNGNYNLEDIVIRADTKMNVARGNVISIETTAFRRKWYKQNLGNFNKHTVVKNNKIVDDYLNEFSKEKISLARTDGEFNVEFFEDTASNFKEMIIDKLNIFNYEPLNGMFFDDLNDENVDVLLMDNLKQGYREREFNKDNVVNNLHQGQDKSNINDCNFFGDSKVIRNKKRITIQIFNVLPKKEKQKKEEFVQYMFAIYLPIEGKYFRRKKQ